MIDKIVFLSPGTRIAQPRTMQFVLQRGGFRQNSNTCEFKQTRIARHRRLSGSSNRPWRLRDRADRIVSLLSLRDVAQD
ncbi:hypothetical protein ACVWWG_009525 [Bradyrhizobium sp. LB7.2]